MQHVKSNILILSFLTALGWMHLFTFEVVLHKPQDKHRYAS